MGAGVRKYQAEAWGRGKDVASRGMGGSLISSNPKQPHRRQQLSCNSLAVLRPPSEAHSGTALPHCTASRRTTHPNQGKLHSDGKPTTASVFVRQGRAVTPAASALGGGGTTMVLSSSVASRHYGCACGALRLSNGHSISASHTSTHPTHPTGRGPGFSPAPQITAAWPLGHAGTGNAGS